MWRRLGGLAVGVLPLKQACGFLELSYRQGKRLWRRYRSGGAAGLQHGLCGRDSNRGHPAEFRAADLKRVEERYADFGPTLASEHLAADDGLAVNPETLRRWLRASGRPAERERKAYRKRRQPKAHFGELLQLDGSFHDWLEDRGGKGCLMHLVDDATSTALFSFSPEETTWAAANLLRAWIERYGVPRALYTDWKNVYVRPATVKEQLHGIEPSSEFGRMCAALGIRIIAAGSPQAKGRVERAHGTHQDRLVKKLRLAGYYQRHEAANPDLLPTAISADHNRRFARRRRRQAAELSPPDGRRRGRAAARPVLAGGASAIVSATTGWCATKTSCCNWSGRVSTGRRLRAGCGCGRMSKAPSRSPIASSLCPSPRFRLRHSRAGEGALPPPPHPRSPALTRFNQEAQQPITLGEKAGSK